MRQIGQQLSDVALADASAILEQEHLIAEAPHRGQVVADQ
jgi:hypothetical protein